MKMNRVRISPVKGRNQVIITFNKELLKDSGFGEGDYVMMIWEENKITLAKEDNIKINI